MDEDIVNTEKVTETTTDTEVKTQKEECIPCKLNIGAAMMITICRDIASKDPDFGMNCEIMERELTEKEDKVALHIIEDIYQKVMEKGNIDDKEVVQEIYDLSKGKEAIGGE